MPKTNPLKLTLYALFMLATAAPINVRGAVLVWPILQSVPASEQGSALWIENRGSSPVRFQARVLAWQQVGGRDRYADQSAVLASPPFATIPSGQRQLIRIIRPGPPPRTGELAYRIILDEIPDPASPPPVQGAGLRLQMRYVLPLFLTAPDLKKRTDSELASRVHWQVVTQTGKSMLQITNGGGTHVRLTTVFWGSRAEKDEASLMLSKGFLGYVLAGQTMQFPLPPGAKVPVGMALFARVSDNGKPVALSR
ncbi:fimbrial biogenesis chaperone [Pantoea ananatis]|uniref:fimbrial biogenesis chaperone n=1 Tax=Pantoea ananas TaxID=553 RepID=UPI001FF0C7F6|nr:molecular chaperone [Pantoea ananatis]